MIFMPLHFDAQDAESCAGKMKNIIYRCIKSFVNKKTAVKNISQRFFIIFIQIFDYGKLILDKVFFLTAAEKAVKISIYYKRNI